LLYFEDLSVGYTYGIEPPTSPPFDFHQVTAEQIISFAEAFDPRPQHTDPEAARETTFGGLIASGAHVIAVWTRLALEAQLASRPIAVIAGLGSELRLVKAVRPDDVLGLQIEVTDLRASKSRPTSGVLTARHRMSNQNGELVFDNRAVTLVSRRPEASPETGGET
jgi:acyl dehydratase